MLPPPKVSTTVLSPAQTLVDGRVPQLYSTARRYTLLIIFCFAQFLDAVNNSALFSAIPSLIVALDITESQSTWIISAFQLTFASFLLISGRLSDVYNPKIAFISGIAGLGVISIGAGFVNDKIILIVLRALSGVVAALTIPSALTLIVNVFTEPSEQDRAIAAFGGCGAIGNVLGLVIGAIFVEYASWRWVFWFVALVAIPIAATCLFLIPPQEPALEGVEPQVAKWKTLDIVGVSILTVALILFIFSITSGSTDGWGSAAVLVPLIVSIFMVVGFFYYETIIPPSKAAVPPMTWFFPNFSVLFGTALLPYFWWTTIFSTYTNLWQGVYLWSVISSAVHMIPIGVMSFSTSFTGPLARRISPKYLIIAGESLMVLATILLALADGPDKYWPYVFPGFVIGSTGTMLTFTHTKYHRIFRTSPPAMAGTVGAIFNGALQLGSAVGIAAVGSITSSVQEKVGTDTYAGQRASFWFLLGIVGLELLAVLVFYRVDAEVPSEARAPEAKADAPGYGNERLHEKLDSKTPGELSVSPV
ncbi:MFS general substrate transporter [Amylocystis lapponica]|nr:MFS general substrate transporter [Amylocystis lapponica]